MTPHYDRYYQHGDTPHDAGSPNPVSFLAVPGKSAFDFYVVCQPDRLPASLQAQWRNLVDRAFHHAFEWVGFGAKTSVGYGAMTFPTTGAPPAGAPAQDSAASLAMPLSGSSVATEVWRGATLTYKKNTGEIRAFIKGKSTAPLKNDATKTFGATLGEERLVQLKKSAELKNVAVEVEVQGNNLRLKGLCG